MEILSAAPTPEERGGIRHHLLGVLDPTERCTASRYRDMANDAIHMVMRSGATPVVCGGSGLYISALTTSARFSVESDPELHAQLLGIADRPGGVRKLHDMLEACDPVAAARLHENDVRRVVRALEVFQLTGETQSAFIAADARAEKPYRERIYALDWPRAELYRRINDRVDVMVAAGLFREVQALLDRHQAFPTAGQAIGFSVIAEALAGKLPADQAISLMKQGTRNYAKRQISWIRRLSGVTWVPAQNLSAREIASRIAEEYTSCGEKWQEGC